MHSCTLRAQSMVLFALIVLVSDFTPTNGTFASQGVCDPRFSRRVIALWLNAKLLRTNDAVRLALDGLGRLARPVG